MRAGGAPTLNGTGQVSPGPPTGENAGARIPLMIPGSLFHRAGWTILVGLMATCSACFDPGPQTYGEPVDSERVVALHDLLSEPRPIAGSMVVVSGSIGQVCRSAGCWFVLQEDLEGEHYELYVDLKPAASFTLDQAASGRRAILRGRLAGSFPDIELHANGLAFE